MTNLLMIVATSNDVFIYNMAKWLKSTMEINITIIEAKSSSLSNQNCDSQFFDKVIPIQEDSKILAKMPRLNSLLFPIIKAIKLRKIVESRQYDIIHIQRFMSFIVFSSFLKRHCNKLYVTFWGGELDNDKIFKSNRLFVSLIRRFLYNYVDAIVNSSSSYLCLKQYFPSFKGNFYAAKLGSAPLYNIYTKLEAISKEEAKNSLGYDNNKMTILLGYSGKSIHNHVVIIQELSKHPEFKTRFHLLAPMTRGFDLEYSNKVEDALKSSGYTYTLYKNSFFSDEQMATMRIATDIVFQFSDYDGFSRSIVECMSAKALVLYGSWLNYSKYLEDEHLFAIPFNSISEGVNFLYNIKIEAYRRQLESNNNNCKKNLWPICIHDWANVYNGTAIPMSNETVL